jgi:hypothetical protein
MLLQHACTLRDDSARAQLNGDAGKALSLLGAVLG